MDLATEIIATLSQFLWPLFRVTAMAMVMAILGTRVVPKQIRMMISVAITFAIFKHIPPGPVIADVSLDLFLLIANEIIIGVGIGICSLLVTQSFIFGGQLIAMQSGLGFASMMDPQNGVSVPAVSQLYLMIITLLFLAINGHLVMIEIVAYSFHTLPIGGMGLPAVSIWSFLAAIKVIFECGMSLSLPAVIALLLVNISFGVMTRAAPQLNIMTVGFPITITLGLLIILISLPIALDRFHIVFEDAMELAWHMIMARH